jgi:hypothetical protein
MRKDLYVYLCVFIGQFTLNSNNFIAKQISETQMTSFVFSEHLQHIQRQGSERLRNVTLRLHYLIFVMSLILNN